MRSGLKSSYVQQPASQQPLVSSRNKLDTSSGQERARNEVLQDAFFPSWKDDAGGAEFGQPDEMAKQDPLGIQMWKLFSRTKAQLPNQERMDNLTWRMMSMNLKRKEMEEARWVLPHRAMPLEVADDGCSRSSKRQQQQHTSGLSGIAQLRRESQMNHLDAHSDEMNIDDFIEPNSTSTPANPTPSPSTPPSHSLSSAIPIKQRRDNQQFDVHPNFPPSAPSYPRPLNREFDYVQRRVRKTSIDETRVGSPSSPCMPSPY